MKTKAIEFMGCCELGRCGSGSDSLATGGVEFILDGDLADDMGEMLCCECALWLARMLKKRVREARAKRAAGLEYGGDPLKWHEAKPAKGGV